MPSIKHARYVGSLIVIAILVIAVGALVKDPEDNRATTSQSEDRADDHETVIVEHLEIPWEIAFLPDGSLLVTERPGRLVRIASTREVISIAGVAHRGEGGLLGMALHPQFTENSFVYLYLTTAQEATLTNRVDRYRLEGNDLFDRTTIIDNIPGSSNHDGGRIAFGPDGYLYITTGDAGVEAFAQNTQSLAGKILRVNDDGSIPTDNPFDNAVYSYGHRNPQGIAWDDDGRLFATEHGRSGVRSGFDEINLIVKGGNYGWPEIQGDGTAPGMTLPLAHSGSDTTWAPAGMAIVGDKIFFAGLRGKALYAATVSGDRITNMAAHLEGEYGRLRSVTLSPDGFLYILTNNRDGRGDATPDDDKIIRIDANALR